MSRKHINLVIFAIALLAVPLYYVIDRWWLDWRIEHNSLAGERPNKILFLCVHNSARSQMAEAFMKRDGRGCFEAESAGLEPGHLNPHVVRAMAEVLRDSATTR